MHEILAIKEKLTLVSRLSENFKDILHTSRDRLKTLRTSIQSPPLDEQEKDKMVKQIESIIAELEISR